MDTKTPKWYGLVKLGESSHELNVEPASLRALFNQAEMLTQSQSGQFTRSNGDIVIRFSMTKPNAVSEDLLKDSRFDNSSTDVSPIAGETHEQYAERLAGMDFPESLIRHYLFDQFGITSEQYEITRKWQADTDIRRLIRATANGEEFERMGVPEYRRLQEYALTQYPSMCADIQWRVAL